MGKRWKYHTTLVPVMIPYIGTFMFSSAMEKVSKREQSGQMKKLQTEIQEVKSDLRYCEVV